jgi:chloramphenicol O-acetyltransferase type B
MLLEMNWWDWTDEQLAGAMPLFTSNRIADLHAYWQSTVLTR